MRPPSSDRRWDANSGGLTTTEDISLLWPTPQPKSDDYPVGTNARPPEPPLVLGSPEATPNVAALDDLFSRPQTPRLTSPQRQQGDNAQAQSGGGGVPGGVSTPNTGAGGNGASSSGAGPAVTNATQFLSANFNLAGSASPAATVPALATPAAPSHLAATAAGHHAAAAAAATATVTPTPATAPAPAAPLALVKKRRDPLFVLDMNTGETLPANVSLNSFSTWSENLLAQVSGATVSTYLWSTTAAPDLTVTSGLTSANLQGTWASFVGPARTETVSVTETPTVGAPLSQTITFLVAGTDSPAFAASRPTSSATWPSVLTPDKLQSDEASVAGGPYANLGLADGWVQTAFTMPAYNPGATPAGLIYTSTAANAQPIFLAEYQLPAGQAVPATITAQLTFNNVAGSTLYYNTSGLNPGDWVQIALQANATGLGTGRYPWSITVTNGTATNYSGNVDIVNQANSPFGAGWSLGNVETLVPVTGGVMLVNPDGTSLWFANGATAGTFTTPAGDFSTLTQNITTGVYTRKLPNGTAINFDSTGKQTSIVDRDGNTTSFSYNASNQLTGITDFVGLPTTLSYNAAGKLATIQDPALRTTTLAYTGSQLTSITDPASNLWQYAYDSANRLTTLTDPRLDATTFAYNFAGRASSVTRADLTTEQLTPEQINGLAAPGTGTQANPATAVLLAAGDAAQFTDPRSNVWATGLDWLGFGKRVQSADPLSDTALIYRDGNGLPWLIADPLARRMREFFDTNGNPTKIVQPDDSYLQYSYNSFSEPTTYIDATGGTTTNTYNAKGDLTQVQDALLHTWTYTYDAKGFVLTQTDPLLRTTTLAYDTRERLTSITNALLQQTTFSYDSASNRTGLTDARGFASTFAYDAMGRQTGATVADTATTNSIYTYTYDGVGNRTKVTDPLLHSTTFNYDKLNRPSSTVDALNETTTLGYDAAGNNTTITNPLNQTTTYGYDAANRPTTITNALNQTTTIAYDAAGEKTSVTDPLLNTTNYSYTPLGQLAKVTDPLSDVLAYTYNAAGDRTTIVETAPAHVSLTASMAYNAIHQETSYTDPANNVYQYAFDAAGNRTSVTDPLNHTTTYAYNAINQLVSITDPLLHTTTLGYDADGNQNSITDPLNRTTTNNFDAQGRLLTVTDPLLGVTTYTYDLAGNQTSLTDPVGNTTSFAYDAVNRLSSMTDPLLRSITYSYNAASQMTSETDRNGRVRNFGYDAVGRQTSETWLNSLSQVIYTATYTFDAGGNRTGASDSNSVYAYGYDAAHHLTSVDNLGTPGVPHVVLSYGYDVYNNRVSLNDNVGGAISFAFDADHRLTTLQVYTGSPSMTLDATVTFGYDAASRLTGITRSNTGIDTITSAYSYDNADRLTNITHTDTTKVPALTLASYTYGYDAANQLTSYSGPDGSLAYGYDVDGQLTSVTGARTENFTYDKNGNRTMAGYTTGAGNRLTSDGVYNYTYDNEGNMLTQTRISDGQVTNYTWDYRNRLTEVVVKTSAGTVLNDEKFTYDVNNNRIGVMLNGVQQSWTVYDGANPYLDFNGAGAVTQRYLTDPRGLSQFYARVSGSGFSATVNWYLTDNIHSIRQIVDTSGNVLDALTYSSFGNILSESNAANGDRFKYAGGANDSITGNNHFGRREETPADGRWISQDPLGVRPDTNTYRYTYNTPTTHTDPNGEFPIIIIGGIVVIAAASVAIYTEYQAIRSGNSVASHKAAWGGLVSGLYDGGAMLANAATFHQIPSLNNYVNQQLEQNGGAYQVANVSNHVGAYALYAAGLVWAWSALGLPTFSIGVQPGGPMYFHTIYGVARGGGPILWANAVGPEVGAMGVYGAPSSVVASSYTLTGIPIFFPSAALPTGYILSQNGQPATNPPAYSCLTSALEAWICGYFGRR